MLKDQQHVIAKFLQMKYQKEGQLFFHPCNNLITLGSTTTNDTGIDLNTLMLLEVIRAFGRINKMGREEFVPLC